MIAKTLENGVQIYTNIILKNAIATIVVLSLVTVLLLQSALTFEQNMTRDIEVYLPEGEESTEILIEVRQDWATDLIIVYIETGNAKDPGVFNDIVVDACLNHKTPLLTSYLYDTCKLYNSFYAECSVANAESSNLKSARLALSRATAEIVKNGLALLGVNAPNRM